MTEPVRERDFEEERRERDRFLLLQHAFTLAEGDPTTVLPGGRVWRDLGFSRTEGSALVDGLIRGGYLEERCTGRLVRLTRQGADFLERRARRRRSVRLVR